MIVSRAGDWTSKQIDNPPKEIWVRGIPTWGMISVASLFRKVLFVATGSGVAPICPWLFSLKVPFRLLWTSPNVRQTFGDELVDAIFDAAPDSIIYGMIKSGSPTYDNAVEPSLRYSYLWQARHGQTRLPSR